MAERKHSMNIASWVTLSRFFLLLPAIMAVVAGWNDGWFVAAVITALAGLTDVVDGYLARRTGCITSFGANLDLTSDKVFVGAMFGLAAWLQLIPLWVPVVVIIREIIIAILRLVRSQSNPIVPDAWGKIKTVVSFVAVVMIFMQRDIQTGGILAWAGTVMPLSLIISLTPWVTLAAVLLTVGSGINYLLRYSILPERKPHSISHKADSISV